MFDTYAITVEGGGRPSITGNLIEGKTGASFTETSGISIEMADCSEVSCNTIANVETQIAFFGNNQRADIKGNQLINGGIGLKYGDPLLENDPTFTGPQLHKGNRWIGPFEGYGAAFYNADLNDLNASKYEVFGGNNQNFIPSLLPGVTGWFDLAGNSSTPFYTCPSGLPPTGNVGGKEVVDLITKGDYNAPGNWLASEWLAESRILRGERLGEIATNQHAAWNSWRAQPTVGDAAEFQVVENLLSDPYALSVQETDDLDAIQEESDVLQRALTMARIQKYQNLSANQITLDQTIANKKVQLAQKQTDFDLIFNAARNRVSSNLEQAIKLNEKLPEPNLPASLQKQVNRFSIAVLSGGLNNTAGFATQIINIAEECPLDGGEAVYQARALASALNLPTNINAQNNCAKETEGKKLAFDDTVSNRIFPNPAGQYFNFDLDDQETDRVSVVDLNGREVLGQNLNAPLSEGQISLPEMKSGVYLIRFLLKGEQVSAQLVIIKQ